MNQTNLFNFKVNFLNKKEYHLIKDEVFGNNIYRFELKKDNPVIIDVGSHIGISILYFKYIYPNSKILGFEPNPILFDVLKENVFINNLDDVELKNIAISNKDGVEPLYIDKTGDDWQSNSSLIEGGWTKKEILHPVEVNCEKLSNYLNREVDILKIDVEGFELTILKEIEEKLNMVSNIAIEFHPGQNIKKILDILNRSGFKTIFLQEGKQILSPNPERMTIVHGLRD